MLGFRQLEQLDCLKPVWAWKYNQCQSSEHLAVTFLVFVLISCLLALPECWHNRDGITVKTNKGRECSSASEANQIASQNIILEALRNLKN